METIAGGFRLQSRKLCSPLTLPNKVALWLTTTVFLHSTPIIVVSIITGCVCSPITDNKSFHRRLVENIFYSFMVNNSGFYPLVGHFGDVLNVRVFQVYDIWLYNFPRIIPMPYRNQQTKAAMPPGHGKCISFIADHWLIDSLLTFSYRLWFSFTNKVKDLKNSTIEERFAIKGYLVQHAKLAVFGNSSISFTEIAYT